MIMSLSARFAKQLVFLVAPWSTSRVEASRWKLQGGLIKVVMMSMAMVLIMVFITHVLKGDQKEKAENVVEADKAAIRERVVPKIIENKREESFVSNEKNKTGRVEEKKRGRGEKVQKKKKESVMKDEGKGKGENMQKEEWKRRGAKVQKGEKKSVVKEEKVEKEEKGSVVVEEEKGNGEKVQKGEKKGVVVEEGKGEKVQKKQKGSVMKEKGKGEKMQMEGGRGRGEEKESVVEEDKDKNTIKRDFAALRENPGVKANGWDYTIEIRENEKIIRLARNM